MRLAVAIARTVGNMLLQRTANSKPKCATECATAQKQVSPDDVRSYGSQEDACHTTNKYRRLPPRLNAGRPFCSLVQEYR